MRPARKPSRPFSTGLPVLVLVAVALLAAACTPDNPQSTFGVGGPVAKQQADLFIFIFWIAVAVFILVEGAIIYFALRFRAKRGAAIPAQTHGNTKLEIAWTILPALILIAIAIPTVKGIYDTYTPAEDLGDPLEVEAIGHQWWFEFRYTEEEIVTANELYVPVGRPVLVKLTSQDVIHSFWVPKLAGKVDMVPVRENQVWFLANEPDTYLGQCVEFCGISHAKMRFRVIAVTLAEYEEWAAGMHRAPVAPAAGSRDAEGRTLFASNCSTCHTVDSYRDSGYAAEVAAQTVRWEAWRANPDPEGANPARIVSAPNLTHFGMRSTIGAGVKPLDKETLLAWIKDPSSIKQGTRMQAHAAVYQTDGHRASLSDDEVDKIAAYLLSLKPSAADVEPEPGGPAGGSAAERGQELFLSSGCSACHSTGDNRVVGPGLKGVYERAPSRKPGMSADDYIKESIKSPNAYVVDGYPAAMVLSVQLTDAQIADIIEYLKTLK